MPETLHLVKVPVLAAELTGLAKRRGLPLRHLDDGYLCHWVLREVFGDLAPAPFVAQSRGRVIELWGYSRAGHVALSDHARAFGDPSILRVMGDLDAVSSKPMPVFAQGRRLGFLVRACPVARLARSVHGHRAGAEVDTFLARCFAAGPDVVLSREAAYRDWLATRLDRVEQTGVSDVVVRVAAMTRERLVRRTQGPDRTATSLERPDVRFDGEMTVADGKRLLGFLSRGVGRHKAFGFGAVIIVPPGTTYDS